jgi:hypothetical protein
LKRAAYEITVVACREEERKEDCTFLFRCAGGEVYVREEFAEAVGELGHLGGHWWQQLGECSES